MRNPLPATLWFLKHDAQEGLLQENGFRPSESASADVPVFSRGNFYLHDHGFWVERSDHHLVYRNPSRSFYRLDKSRRPLEIPTIGETRVGLEEGFSVVASLLLEHETFIQERCGTSYRASLIKNMPRAELRYAKNWKLLFGSERRVVTT